MILPLFIIRILLLLGRVGWGFNNKLDKVDFIRGSSHFNGKSKVELEGIFPKKKRTLLSRMS